MRVLSNLLGGGDCAKASKPADDRAAPGAETEAALALILGGGGPPADATRVADFLEFASQRGIDPSDLRVARDGQRIGWAALPVMSPGKTMLVLHSGPPPRGLDAGPVIRAVCELGAARRVQLAQALVDPADAAARVIFANEAFAPIAELLYLHRLVRKPTPPPPLSEGLRWETYSESNHGVFGQTILHSYQGSLDCPALNGLREMEDVIAGHKSSGEFDPRFWFLLVEGDSPLGVLLLSKVPRSDGVELVYLGLIPHARGRGIGDLLVQQALSVVRQMNLSLLSLAVDSKNAPALRLYFRHGFQQTGSKLALMRDLRSTAGGQS